ncbi:MAG: CHASE2 domain-containing protein [Cyanobacteria bacterium J06560_2]
MRKRFGAFTRMVPGLIASVSVVTLMQLQVWEPIDRMVHNQVVRWHGSRSWDDRLVIVNIDDKTLGELGQFPISRDYYGQLIERLRKSDASVVVFNLILSDNSPMADNLREGGNASASARSATSKMAREMANHGRVVIGQTWSQDGAAVEPVPVLTETAIATGHMRLPIDLDGFTRLFELTYKGFPALGVAAIQAYSLEDDLISIPTNVEQLRLNWPGPIAELNTLSLVDVLNGTVPEETFQGKIVIVGYGATSGLSPMRTPFDNRWPVPGGFMHAAVIDNLLNQNWLRTIPNLSVAIALLLSGPLFSWLLYRRRILVQFIATGACSFGWLLTCIAALQAGYMLPVVPPMVMIGGAGLSLFVWGRLQSNALLQVRSAFLSTMSHEIRTPLNAITNLSEMLQETPLDDRQREYVETLCSSSQTLMALINDVLDFSKIEAGKLTLEDYPMSLAETLERSIELLAPRATEKSIELAYAIDASAPTMLISDPVRLQQILINLLSNAVKFTEAGEVSVRVSARPIQPRRSLLPRSLKSSEEPSERRFESDSNVKLDESAGWCEMCFEVSDTGIGIPAERLTKLFEPFSQVSASTTRKYGGTGLGLSISKRLSERMGGDLWVKSTLGRGSTFYFTFQAKSAQASASLPDYLSALKGTHLLLIDRNKTRCEQISRELQLLDISLVRATSLAEAVVFIHNTPAFDGVILDGAIADRFGDKQAAIDTLRKAIENNRFPVILLSQLKSDLQPLSNDVTILWKPVKQASLYQALRSIKPFTLTAAPNSSAEPPSLLPNARRQSLKILVAEDNRTNQKVALRLLELLGYEADVVSSGGAVLEALASQRYDVILMDMRMPDMDGVETTRQIRQGTKQSDIWIIAMTANAMARDRKLCFAAGMNDYLRKPIKRQALDEALQQVVLGPVRRLPG